MSRHKRRRGTACRRASTCGREGHARRLSGVRWRSGESNMTDVRDVSSRVSRTPGGRVAPRRREIGVLVYVTVPLSLRLSPDRNDILGTIGLAAGAVDEKAAFVA